MKRKFLILTLCFTIIFSSFNYKKVEAFAPAVPIVAPQVISSLGALMVMCGIKYVDYKQLNSSIRDIWETKDFQTEILPSIEKAISNSVDGVVTFGENVVNWFRDTYFPTVQQGQSIIYSSVPCYVPSLSEEKYFGPGVSNSHSLDCPVSPIYNVNYNDSCDYDLGSGLFLRKSSYTDMCYLYYNYDTIAGWDIGDYGNSISVLFMNGHLRLLLKTSSSWITSGYSITDYMKSHSDDYVDTTYTWNNVGLVPSIDDNEISISIPNNVNDLIGVDIWNPSIDQVWTGNESISIPSLDNPLIGVGDDIFVDVPDVDVPDVDVPDVDVPDLIFPPFPSFGDSLDFSPMYLTNINEKFPFSLPWDIGRLIQKFDIEPKAPIFKVPIVSSEIELDLTIFDEWANIGRFFVLIGFVLSLILISTKLLG